ncbi:hypothetical protein HK097_000426 [Rhizophlyctis rosea]|uniref:DRBM domain-containing protein n=1 Tax=Rhizophlyctis rosea TaxID=64517 RepID=A0AAD5S6S3_9FUNG|nr:hypothetical protein HK097_000426 [Rhizophlyctis rosea]
MAAPPASRSLITVTADTPVGDGPAFITKLQQYAQKHKVKAPKYIFPPNFPFGLASCTVDLEFKGCTFRGNGYRTKKTAKYSLAQAAVRHFVAARADGFFVDGEENHVSKLQRLCQSHKKNLPDYVIEQLRVSSASAPSARAQFIGKVRVGGTWYHSPRPSRSKADAKNDAAMVAYNAETARMRDAEVNKGLKGAEANPGPNVKNPNSALVPLNNVGAGTANGNTNPASANQRPNGSASAPAAEMSGPFGVGSRETLQTVVGANTAMGAAGGPSANGVRHTAQTDNGVNRPAGVAAPLQPPVPTAGPHNEISTPDAKVNEDGQHDNGDGHESIVPKGPATTERTPSQKDTRARSEPSTLLKLTQWVSGYLPGSTLTAQKRSRDDDSPSNTAYVSVQSDEEAGPSNRTKRLRIDTDGRRPVGSGELEHKCSADQLKDLAAEKGLLVWIGPLEPGPCYVGWKCTVSIGTKEIGYDKVTCQADGIEKAVEDACGEAVRRLREKGKGRRSV